MSKISCVVLNITKLKKKNVFVASRNIYSTTLTMFCRLNDLFSGWNHLELYSDWSSLSRRNIYSTTLTMLRVRPAIIPLPGMRDEPLRMSAWEAKIGL